MTMYSTDGKGNWTKRIWSEKCPEKFFLNHKCQGVKGHDGNHWCYGEDGSYFFGVPGELEPHDIRCGSTPPNNEDWINPVDKSNDYYMSNYTDVEVTDLSEIARLESGDVNDDESINGPIDWEELDEETSTELKRRIKAYDTAKQKKETVEEYLAKHAVLDGKGNMDGMFVAFNIAMIAVEKTLKNKLIYKKLKG